MEVIKFVFKIAFSTLLIFSLNGCSSTEKNINKPKNKVNLISIENKADIAYMSGHLEMAEALYRELLQTRSDYAPAWFRLGNIYTRTNRLNAAVSAYQNCLQNIKNMKKLGIILQSHVFVRQQMYSSAPRTT